MTPSAVRVDRLSFDDMISAIESRSYERDHEVYWGWFQTHHESRDLAFHGAPFLAINDEELLAFKSGLSLWIERGDIWQRAYMVIPSSTVSGRFLGLRVASLE